MLGMNIVGYTETGVWGQKKGLLDYNNAQFALATGTQTSGGGYSWNSTAGFFGRFNYNYKEKYLFEANLRRDGSSAPLALVPFRFRRLACERRALDAVCQARHELPQAACFLGYDR